ncbi:hypothetical protein GCM10011609_77220 [Lentzea pudingi]|uniref:FXSXX-COOH protein n=1 Tax=Lentzea pudingi TaxID=1789439 RepID=A0ABQ2IST4_9PSEU|nr:hypothetical protein [Lentzea pudingi]GGN24006.1 hypothetical protein GCM10011609_77220 [Lentzea pudingi]
MISAVRMQSTEAAVDVRLAPHVADAAEDPQRIVQVLNDQAMFTGRLSKFCLQHRHTS